jgi:TM2 domain-containing membrane protein YozV
LNEPLEFRGLLRRWAMKPFEFQKTDKNPAVAAILSFFFMGLGQAYNGEIAKAVVFLILYAISIFLTFFIIGFVTIPILWIWSIVDAYKSSQKIKWPKGNTPLRHLFTEGGKGGTIHDGTYFPNSVNQ